MKKYVLVTDTHLGRSNENELYLNTTLNLFNVIIEYCIDNNIKDIIHCGDFFDKKIFGSKNITYKTIEISEQIFQNITNNGLTLYIIVGNHDLILKTQNIPNSLTFFKNYNINLIDEEPFILNNITLAPWKYDIAELDDNDILLGHFEINGCYRDNKTTIDDVNNYSINDFNHFKQVYSGHIHLTQKNKNIMYIGSPYQMNYGDPYIDRGFYVLTENNELEMIVYNEAPKFITINEYDNLKTIDIENNNVRIKLNDNNDIKNEKFVNEIKKLNPLNVKIEWDLKEKENDITLDEEIKEKEDILFDYIDKIEKPEYIKEKMLKTILNSLLKEI